jgi:hypothetical protein
MKMKILLAAFAAIAFFAAPPAHASDEGLLIGTWEMNTTMNGYMERGVMVLRANGTGRHDRFVIGEEGQRSNFTWKLESGGIRFFYTRREIKYAQLRFVNTNAIVLTPANSAYQAIGPQLDYARQFEQGSVPRATVKKNVIGVWEAAGTNDFGQSCRSELVLRVYGTGSDAISCGAQRQEVPITWEFIDGVVIKFGQNGNAAKGRVRFLDKTTMGITPLDFSGMQNGAEIFYRKIAENDEGC